MFHRGRSSAQNYLTYTFLFGKVISLPRLVYFLIRWRYCNVPQLSSSWARQRCAQEPNFTLNTVTAWSSNDSHLALNSKETKTMLLSTIPLSYVHSLHKNRPVITISGHTLEYVNVSKLLANHFHQHINWDEQLNLGWYTVNKPLLLLILELV